MKYFQHFTLQLLLLGEVVELRGRYVTTSDPNPSFNDTVATSDPTFMEVCAEMAHS